MAASQDVTIQSDWHKDMVVYRCFVLAFTSQSVICAKEVAGYREHWGPTIEIQYSGFQAHHSLHRDVRVERIVCQRLPGRLTHEIICVRSGFGVISKMFFMRCGKFSSPSR